MSIYRFLFLLLTLSFCLNKPLTAQAKLDLSKLSVLVNNMDKRIENLSNAQAKLDTSKISVLVSNMDKRIESLSNELIKEKNKNNDSQWAAYLSLIISAIVLGISFFQYFVSKKAIKSEVAIGLYNEFREQKWEECRTKIYANRKATNFDEVKTYSFLLNHFGFLLEHKYIDANSIYDMMGRSVFVAWYSLSDQILKRRKLVDNVRDFYPFQYHFQYLESELRKVEKKRRNHIEKLIAKMGNPDRSNAEVPQTTAENSIAASEAER